MCVYLQFMLPKWPGLVMDDFIEIGTNPGLGRSVLYSKIEFHALCCLFLDL